MKTVLQKNRVLNVAAGVLAAVLLIPQAGSAINPGEKPGAAKTSASSQGARLDDSAIVAIYNQVNGFDIETGRLGMEKGYSAEVRDLGKLVTNDHSAVRKAAGDLAEKLGIQPVLPEARAQAAQDHEKVIADLKRKSGPDFDRAYLLHEIAFHTNAIDAVKEVLVPNIQNPELKKLVLDILPGFEHHLSETKRVAKELGYTS